MPIRLAPFEQPNQLSKDEGTATETYAKFTAEPFEIGYGYTIGNSLRRVLLSSLEGAAITSIKIDGAQHEFATIEGVVEDVAESLAERASAKGLELIVSIGPEIPAVVCGDQARLRQVLVNLVDL